MNIMLILVGKNRMTLFMFQRVKSSQLEEVEKSLKTLESENENMKNMVSKLTKKKEKTTKERNLNNKINYYMVRGNFLALL